MVTKLDRLARSMLHLCAIGEELARKKVELEVLDQAIETYSATGRLLFHLLGAFAEFETTLRRERQQEGIAHAKGRGVRFGRTHALSALQVDQLRQRRANGEPIKVLVCAYALSKTSVYRYLDGVCPQAATPEAEAADEEPRQGGPKSC